MTIVRQKSPDERQPYEESEGICKQCTRTVYFDNWHYYINKDGVKKAVTHDRKWSPGDNIPNAHWDHCPAVHGSPKQREFYKDLRVSKGYPEVLKSNYNAPDKEGETVDLKDAAPATQGELIPVPTIPESDNVEIVTKQQFKKLEEEVKTLQVQYEILTKSFNEYVEATTSAVKKFINDVRNGYLSDDRSLNTMENFLEQTDKEPLK